MGYIYPTNNIQLLSNVGKRIKNIIISASHGPLLWGNDSESNKVAAILIRLYDVLATVDVVHLHVFYLKTESVIINWVPLCKGCIAYNTNTKRRCTQTRTTWFSGAAKEMWLPEVSLLSDEWPHCLSDWTNGPKKARNKQIFKMNSSFECFVLPDWLFPPWKLVLQKVVTAGDVQVINLNNIERLQCYSSGT